MAAEKVLCSQGCVWCLLCVLGVQLLVRILWRLLVDRKLAKEDLLSAVSIASGAVLKGSAVSICLQGAAPRASPIPSQTAGI